MSFPKYPAYKDSGVEWLGEVPEHWVVKQLRYLGRFRKGLTITKADLADTGIPCLNYGEVHSLYPFEVNQDIQPLKCVPDEFLKTNPSASVKYGDFVFADTSEDLDGVGNFTHVSGVEPLFAGYHTIIYSLDSAVSSRFLAYCLNSFAFRTQLRLSVKGVKVFSVTQEILRGGTVWLPTTAEQTQIARFLDHETARIDALIEEQQRLIELLKEKRQAVISHAVTKGLDPTVPMKDSGVEWLGEVPAHWQEKPFFSLISERREPNAGVKQSNLLSLSYGRIVNKDINTSDGLLPASFETYQVVYPGDIVFRLTDLQNDKRSLRSAIVREVGIITSAYLAGICIKILPEFANYLFRAYDTLKVFYSMGGGLRQSMKYSDMKWLPIMLPSEREQTQIAHFLDHETARIDALIEEANTGVVLLKERRSALISAAVTGKIDVRNWQPPASVQAPEAEQEAV